MIDISDTNLHKPGEITLFHDGKTLRDEFAMKILEAAAYSGDPIDMRKGETEREALYRFWRGIAEGAYIAADAMMREREKRE